MTGGGPPLDWAEWHQPYDDPDSLLPGRLRRVQAHLQVLLDRQLFTFTGFDPAAGPLGPAAERTGAVG